MNRDSKQRVTSFVDQDLVKRAKVRGALEGLTISEIVEKALDAYAPEIETHANDRIHLKFANASAIDTYTHQAELNAKRIAPKHTKPLSRQR